MESNITVSIYVFVGSMLVDVLITVLLALVAKALYQRGCEGYQKRNLWIGVLLVAIVYKVFEIFVKIQGLAG